MNSYMQVGRLKLRCTCMAHTVRAPLGPSSMLYGGDDDPGSTLPASSCDMCAVLPCKRCRWHSGVGQRWRILLDSFVRKASVQTPHAAHVHVQPFCFAQRRLVPWPIQPPAGLYVASMIVHQLLAMGAPKALVLALLFAKWAENSPQLQAWQRGFCVPSLVCTCCLPYGAYVAYPSRRQELDFIEFFAGVGEVSRALKEQGRKGLSVDIEHCSSLDIMRSGGFA